jgi:hypothetical protein
LPVGGELIIPYLAREAKATGFAIEPEDYGLIYHVGEKRRSRLRELRLADTNLFAIAVHSWEAWGNADCADGDLVDGYGSLGMSPSATVAHGERAAASIHIPTYWIDIAMAGSALDTLGNAIHR